MRGYQVLVVCPIRAPSKQDAVINHERREYLGEIATQELVDSFISNKGRQHDFPEKATLERFAE
jgi:hypothetical protein